jgi:formylglycine-generating enzyme required for sulfatase activity
VISDIAAQTIDEGSNSPSLYFTIGDAETVADSLIISGVSSNTSLIPNANIVFGGSDGHRTVKVTPAKGKSGTATITVTVSDGSLSASDTFLLTVNSVVPDGFSLIPTGTFRMGDCTRPYSYSYNIPPPRLVKLDAFHIGKYEVTKSEWNEVRLWAEVNGYTDLVTGNGKANNHPVHSISWHQAVKWCNARSQKEGLTPVYYLNDEQTMIYKTGSANVTNARVKWAANGYRLPTEAEWEKAARGGLSYMRFPWGDTISHSQANYYARSSYAYDLSGAVNDCHPTYNDGVFPYTSPAGAFAANGYGLYDMAGNVWEWCWDWYGTYDEGSQINPTGALSGANRVCRGGSWYDYNGNASNCRVDARNYFNPISTINNVGFRVVRSSDSK